MKTKVYINANHDGRNSSMVCAVNLAEAAAKLNTTANYMRTYGWHYAEGKDKELSENNPDTVFVREIMSRDEWLPKC